MTKEDIKKNIIQTIKSKLNGTQNSIKIRQFQFDDFTKNFYDNNPNQYEIDKRFLWAKETINEFINRDLMFVGNPDNGSEGFPWLTVTDYGAECFNEGKIITYDPDSFLQDIKTNVPNIDDITLKYLAEAVDCFNRNNLLSSTICIGVASENLILNLVEAYFKAISDTKRKNKFEKSTKDKFIFLVHKEFRKEVDLDMRFFPKDIRENFDVYIDTIFNFIRVNRNDSGHPGLAKVNAKNVYASLQMFSNYSQYIIHFTEYLQTHQV